MTELTSWWDVAQKIGSGAAFVLGIGFFFLWKAYSAELVYSKSRDTQTLTVLLNLTNMIEHAADRDKEIATRTETGMASLLTAINELKDLVRNHYRAIPTDDGRNR